MASAELAIKITNPINEEHVSDPVPVSGTILGDMPGGSYLWILVNPSTSPGLYWPQGGAHLTPFKGLWTWNAYLGGNSGDTKDIVVALVDEKSNKDFIEWNAYCVKTGDWQGLGFPDTGKIMDKVTVIKN